MKKNRTDIVALLINAGANLDIKDNYGDTAVIKAAMHSNTEIAKLLVENNANLDLQDNFGYTAIIYAVQRRNIDIVKALIEKGANLDIKNSAGRTVIEDLSQLIHPSDSSALILDLFRKAKRERNWQEKRLLFIGNKEAGSILNKLPKDIIEYQIGPYIDKYR